MATRILVVEDNLEIAQLIRQHLESDGYDVTLTHDGTAGLSEVESQPYDLIILDLILPGIDGIELCRLIRAQKGYIPILMLTSKDDVVDRVIGLEVGADDYLTKPFSFRELTARVRAIVRLVEKLGTRESPDDDGIVRVGSLVLDPERRSVSRNGREIRLTTREFEILSLLTRHPGKVFSRSQLLREVWGYTNDCYAHTVDSHMSRLRSKLEDNPSRPDLVLTVWGVGYKLNDEGIERSTQECKGETGP
ncbi:MAG: DNA-binding response regulator [Desulfuromonadales bacterium]|nr:MAG: DNA-binding response regulator [Desulfuromonadales bacterium]